MNKQKIFVKYIGLYNLKTCREIKKYVYMLYSFNAMHNSRTTFVYAETRIKLVISEFLSARADCDGRRQSVHLFSVKGREQGRPNVTLRIVQ